MKKLLYLLIFCAFLPEVSAQFIFISTSDQEILKLNMEDCSYEYITSTPVNMHDITFHPNSNLFGVVGNGTLYQIDPITGLLTFIHQFSGLIIDESINSLTASNDGLIYAASNRGKIYTYNLLTSTAQYLGAIPFFPAGDLTFYDGELYVAVTNDRIVKITLDNIGNSYTVIDDNIAGDIFGIVTDVNDCETTPYAISRISNSASKIFSIDFENSSLSYLCDLDVEVYGGASEFEFLASAPLKIDSVSVTNLPNCNAANGVITVYASGGIGDLSYSIDGENFQQSNIFDNLPIDDYTIYIKDMNDCSAEIEFTLIGKNLPVITELMVEEATCNQDNARITFESVESGNGQLQYSIDGVEFQSDNVFENLTGGIYTVYVKDEDNCIDQSVVNVGMVAPTSITNVDIINTTCGLSNGILTVEASSALEITYSIDGNTFQANPNFDNLSGGVYTVSIFDVNGCMDQQTVELESSSSPIIDEVVYQGPDCGANDGFIFPIGSGGTGEVTYAINDGDYSTSSTFENLMIGTYIIKVIDEMGCIAEEIIELTGTSGVTIEALISHSTTCGEADGQIDIHVSDNSSLPISASINGSTFTPSLSYSGLVPDLYDIVIMDNDGCTAAQSVEVVPTRCPIFIPNSFSPNDDGINDYLEILTHPEFNGHYVLFQIFDRWGGIIYNTTNFDDFTGWDGYSNDKKAGEGVYVYLLQIEYGDSEIETLTGDVVLLR